MGGFYNVITDTWNPGVLSNPAALLSSLFPAVTSGVMDALWPWNPYSNNPGGQPTGNPLQPTGATVNGPLQDPNNPFSLLGQGETAQFEYPQAWNDSFPWLNNYTPQEAKGFVDKLAALGIDPGSPTATMDLDAILANAAPTFSTTVTEPAAASLGELLLPAAGVGAAAGAVLPGALAGGETNIPGNLNPAEPTFVEDVYGQTPTEPVSDEALLAGNPELAAILAGTPPQVPYAPAQPEYPALPQNPDFATWPWDTPLDPYGAVPLDPAPTNYGGIVPGPVPPLPYDIAPTDYGGITPAPTPDVLKFPGLPNVTPSVSTGGGGGLGGAALPSGFPVVGDNSKSKSIFELPISMMPMNFIKALQLGGRR